MDNRAQALEALSRSNLYGVLARLTRMEIDQAVLNALREPRTAEALKAMGVDVAATLPEGDDAALLEDLNRAYTHLFLFTVNPHGSVQQGEGQLWGDSTVAANQFMEEAGLAVEGEQSLLPDHISMELAIMQRLSQDEAASLEAGDQERTLELQGLQKRFMQEHLGKWGVEFFGAAEKYSTHAFYSQVAVLGRDFLFADQQALLG